MILRRWDPGIGKEECSGRDKGYVDNNGEWHRRSSPDLVVMGEGNLGILRKYMIMSDLGQISIIINTKSHISDGIGSDLKVLIWILLLVSLMGSCVLVAAKGLWFCLFVLWLLLFFNFWNKNGALCCWRYVNIEVVSDVVGYSMKGLMHETGGEPKDIGSYICFELGLLVHGHRWDNDNTFYLYYFVVVSWYLSRLLTSVCIVVSWLVGNKWVFACCYFCCDMVSSRSDSRGDTWVWRYLVFAWWSGLRVRAYFGPWISGIDFRMHINVWSAYVLGVMVLLEKWQQFEELIIGSHVEYVMWYWVVELKKIHLIGLVLFYWQHGFSLVTFGENSGFHYTHFRQLKRVF